MEGEKDELISYFEEQFNEKYQNYSKRLTMEDFSAQSSKHIKSQFEFLYNSRPGKNSEDKKIYPDILQIRGDFMKSVIDQQIYAIFCQAPSKWNAKHFWSVCYQQKVRKVFMLCTNTYEYWPHRNQELKIQENNITVRCLWEEPIGKVLIRKPIIMTGPQGERKLEHLHFTGWKDGGIPEGQQCLGVFRALVAEAIALIEEKEMIVVHCLAGIGRTGTFGAVLEAVRCAHQLKCLSLFQIVSKMREDRDYCVEGARQYNFAHQQAIILP